MGNDVVRFTWAIVYLTFAWYFIEELGALIVGLVARPRRDLL